MSQQKVILIVDDSPSIRFELKKILSKEGYEVREAGNQIGLYNKIDEYGKLADLIIMDLTLKEENGLDLIKGLKEVPQLKTIPVIVVTEHADKDNVITAKNLGIESYLVKPIVKDQLIERINNLINKNSQINT